MRWVEQYPDECLLASFAMASGCEYQALSDRTNGLCLRRYQKPYASALRNVFPESSERAVLCRFLTRWGLGKTAQADVMTGWLVDWTYRHRVEFKIQHHSELQNFERGLGKYARGLVTLSLMNKDTGKMWRHAMAYWAGGLYDPAHAQTSSGATVYDVADMYSDQDKYVMFESFSPSGVFE